MRCLQVAGVRLAGGGRRFGKVQMGKTRKEKEGYEIVKIGSREDLQMQISRAD